MLTGEWKRADSVYQSGSWIRRYAGGRRGARPVTRLNTKDDDQRLGLILVQKSNLTESQLGRALSYQSESGARLGEALMKLGYVTDEQLAEALAAQKRLSMVHLGDVLP